jgi:biopolymer transport protein TolR
MARQRKQVAAINVVPLIDVMLVLLVVFMITAPFISPGQVELPSVGKTAKSPTQPIEIVLKASGELLLRDRAGDGREEVITQKTLADEVRARLRPEQAVVIAADKSVRYEDVMKLMNALQAADVQRIGLLARPGK